jgi:phage I-like protein
MLKRIAVLKSPVLAPADVPEWWKFLPAGEVYILGEEQPLILDDEAAAAIIANFERLGRDIVIDYEHQTLKDVQAPAAGWIHAFEWRGADGLWVRTSWTEKAAAYIAAKEYRYFSPVMFSRKTDRRIILIANAALTNEPKTRNIEAIAAKLDIESINPQAKEHGMFKKLIQIFKLKEDADQAAVEAAAETVVAKNAELETRLKEKPAPVACKTVLDALGLSADASETMVVGKIEGLTASVPATRDLADQVVKLSGQIADMQVEKLTGQALKNGQTSPEELEKWGSALARKDPEQFRQIVCSRPVGSVVPVGKTPVVPDASGAEVEEAVTTVAKMMDISSDDIKNFGGGEASR